MKKDVAVRRFFSHPLVVMNLIPFPADSTDYEEYVSVMETMADEANASVPDPEPEGFGGRCEDAPCCGCCGNEPYEQQRERFEDESDELRARENGDYWASMHEREDDPEDRYLDSSWEDANEYGMDGCCGDF